MIKLSRLADYAVVLMTHIALRSEGLHTAAAMALETRIPEPTAGKILKALARVGLLESQRGTRGGYALARRPDAISIADIIAAVDGPIALTECGEPDGGACTLETVCPTRVPWQRLNDAVRRALDEVTLAEMASPFPTLAPVPDDSVQSAPGRVEGGR